MLKVDLHIVILSVPTPTAGGYLQRIDHYLPQTSPPPYTN